MTIRIAHAEYERPSGGRVRLVVEKYENEPDFQSFAIARFIDPHDPSFASFAGFDVRSELVALLERDLADPSSPRFDAAKAALLAAFDLGEPV